jgi:hypothetical protein
MGLPTLMQLVGWFVLILSCLCPIPAQAKAIQSAAGLELGGNGTLLISDKSLGETGIGAGLQGSLYLKMWVDRPYVPKLRVETISMHEESVQKSASDYLVAGSSLKSMTQSWTLISAGVEKSFESQGQNFFWEALIGYAIGGSGTVTVTGGVPDQAPTDFNTTVSSGFALSGGIGLHHQFSKLVTGIMTVRTLLFLGAPYNSDPLASKAFIPLPLMFNIGVEMPFPVGN